MKYVLNGNHILFFHFLPNKKIRKTDLKKKKRKDDNNRQWRLLEAVGRAARVEKLQGTKLHTCVMRSIIPPNLSMAQNTQETNLPAHPLYLKYNLNLKKKTKK